MGRGSWYNKWQDNLIFKTGSNMLNENSYVFSYFPRTNQYGFQDANIRGLVLADMYARYLRVKGNNVLFPVGFHSLGASSILEGRKSGTDDDTISDIFLHQYKELGIAINDEKLIDLKDDTFLRLLQQAFLDLYDKGYILYKNKVIYYDEKNNKIYTDPKAKKTLKKITQKCFLLDIKRQKNNILKEIEELDIDKKIKKAMLDYLNPTEIFYIDLFLTNKSTLTIGMLEPEYLGGVSYIFLNPDYIDIDKYVALDEKQNVKEFLESDEDFIYSGSMAINPLTGEKIPVCISRFYNEGIYLGIPAKDEEDQAISIGWGFAQIDLFDDGLFINSDFLNGLDKEDAHKTIIENFTEAEIGRLSLEYINDEINLFSLDNYGPLFPFLENKDELIPIRDHLPFRFSNQYKFQNRSFRTEDGEALGGTINNLFIEGMLPFISLVYDKFLDFNSFISHEAKEAFDKWLPISLLVVDEKSVASELLMPLILFETFKSILNLNSHHLFKKLIVTSKVIDVKQLDIKRSNNNLVDFDKMLEKYYTDSIRCFYLSNKASDVFVLNPYALSDINKNVKELEDALININIGDNKEEDLFYREFRLDVMDNLRLINNIDYVKLVIDFSLKHIINKSTISKSQLLKYLLLISPVFPYLAEEIYEKKFNNKYSIYNEGL